MLKLPDIIKAGAPVTLISRVNGVEVKIDGVALEAGHAGEVIRVRNTSSRKVLRGRIVDEATVEIVHS
jgi:flagella basal body P-ring formation protein FlgA